jgi:hypothetical protein
MSPLDDTRSIERQRFFDGQRLVAGDLQRIEEFNREMRWLHNESLHQPGIGNGFAVAGRKGDREVLVGAGYAIDDLGREIVLTGSRTVPVQPVAGDATGQPQHFVLTVHYPDDADLEEVERREGLCDTRGAVRLREEPIFCWVPLNPDGSPADDQVEILTGRKLVLAEVAVRDCKLDKDVSIVQRRNARPPAQPHIACGVEAPTQWTDWNPWEDPAVETGSIDPTAFLRTFHRIAGGIQADIDTRSAGFRAVPGYFARIDGPRVFEVPSEGGTVPVVLDGQLSIGEPTATGFHVRVLVLQYAANGPLSQPETGENGTIGLVSAGGFDTSALLLGSLASFVRGGGRSDDEPAAAQPEVTSGPATGTDAPATDTAVIEAPSTEAPSAATSAALVEAGELPELVQLVGDAWQVGWMGVEG